ncbi:recombinase family protein [Epilithonimonas pallida]|uniref:recombinase family protein n=1 Tax=Epilithonimonas pallida TaxID=373671 RepID=UPI003623C7BD
MRNLESKKAFLYGRVSTTDQKDNGYSLPQQKKYLLDFCERNKIEVLGYFEEDYTSTTFERPKYKELIIQAKKLKIDYILFHKWDRFSREPEGIPEVEKLLKLGIKPNSISEWIDFNDASYYFYLGIYILQAKVENKKRSERTKDGIIGALREGRFVNMAPIGYINSRDPENPNKPLIKPCPEKAILIKNIFEDFSTGNYSQESLRQKYYKLGIKRGKSQFGELLSNALYAGKIFVPAYKDYPEEIVKGLHEPIVNESLFIKVQMVKNGRIPFKINSSSKSKNDEALPLRGGILKCAKCGGNMTGSPSTNGSGKKVYYYHCQKHKGLNENLPADEVNGKLEELLRSLKPSKGILALFKAILDDKYKLHQVDREKSVKLLNTSKKSIEEKLDKLTEKYVADDLDKLSYERLKNKYNGEMEEIVLKLSEAKDQSNDIQKLVDFGLQLLSNIDVFYRNAKTRVKRQIVRSIFAEKLIFENRRYRTPKLNEAVALIFSFNRGFRDVENKKRDFISKVSASVPRTGIEPVLLRTGV